MDGRTTMMTMMVLLLCAFTGERAAGQSVQDVCASCHANATCDDKSDGSGKVCNCKYGFVGNGRSFCQDKDECQIGASRICGHQTTCHNTYGSFFCTCLSGYTPSNDMDVFIPNDGTHCQDVDECSVAGVCGEGARCRNLDGSFDCSCQVGYKVQDGVEPFQPHTDKSSCKAVDCGPPVPAEDAVVLWLTGTGFGGAATFVCDDGFVWRTGENRSVCGADGLWSPLAMVCEAKCGPIPVLANAEVLWHNRSLVKHRCAAGHHSWRGTNVSVCGSSGVWMEATMNCIETKPPINRLSVFNEKCLRWDAEKYEEDTEVYKVFYTGSREYQRSFRDRGKKFLRSKAARLDLCLHLLPLTNYTVSVTASSARFTASIGASTSLPEPAAPAVHYREFESPSPTLRMNRTPDTLDAISSYQVFVIAAEGMMMFDCSDPFNELVPPTAFIAAQLELRHVGAEMDFTVGDGRLYGGFHNAPLERARNYYIILRAVSRWKTATKSSCVVWAKVRGTSYILRVWSLVAAASVALVVFIIVAVHGFIWCLKKT